MLGELDLDWSASRPGERLTSMMAPSVLLLDGPSTARASGARAAPASAARSCKSWGTSSRDCRCDDCAVDAPRVHAEGGVVHCEDPAAADDLEAAGRAVVRWKERNLYFGGVSAVEVGADGALAAAGDPRRGGAGVVVS